MKNGKILKSLIALSCCLTMGLGVVTGCSGEPECEHVYNWSVTKESTCSEHGINTGVCGLCGDVKEEELPIDESKHVFTGEWEIAKPTEGADGLAVKTCANNSEHKAEVTLPKVTITGKGYDEKEFITVPTTARTGEMKLTLKNTYGDITFNVELAKRKLDNMEDAVILASSLQENVRSVTGSFKQAIDSIDNNFSYYFGDDYTYIDDQANSIEYWYSLDDDGSVFAMSKENGSSTANVILLPDEGCLNGFHYNSSVSVSSFYGAEQGLARLYETAMNGLETGTTVNYKQIDEVKTERDGSLKDIWFSYSYDSGDWFTRFYVKFSTYSDGTLKELFVETEVIRSYMYVTDEAGSAIFYKEDDESVKSGNAVVGDVIFSYIYPSAEGGGNDYESYQTLDDKGNEVTMYVYEQTDEEGNLIYEKHTQSGIEYYSVTYEKLNSGEYDPNPICVKLDGKPEGLKYVYVTDRYGNTVYDEKGEPVKKIMAKDCYLVNERYTDNHPEVSYKTVNFVQTKKVTQEEVDAGLKDPEVVPPNPYPSDSRYIKDFDITGATAAGVTVDISEGLILPTNKAIKFTLGNITPATATLNTDAIANIYVKDATGALIKLKLDFNNGSQYRILGFFTSADGTVTVNSQYAGDVTLVFETQSGKCKKEVNLTFTKSAPTSLSAEADVYTVTDGKADHKTSGVSIDRPVSLIVGQPLIFRAVAAASEAAYVSTDFMPTADRTGITFTQPEKDNYKEWQLVATEPGEYTVRISYYDGTSSSSAVYAQFKVIVSEAMGVTEMLSGNTFEGEVLIAQSTGNPKKTKITAEFTAEGKINITVGGNEIVYTYGVDGSDNLITAWESGLSSADNKSYDFSFSINEAGDLVISHSTGMGTNMEDKVLSKVVATEGQA
ncbi:MAG: hypothetical protein ACI4MQ_02130 [Candidatus Coproplasma sp.]